jgi:hypothetical protein
MDIQATDTDLSKFGELAVMDHTGDTKIIWSRDNQDEIDNARRTFADLRGKGYAAFKVDKKGDKAEQVHEFDPKVERLIFVPALVGG